MAHKISSRSRSALDPMNVSTDRGKTSFGHVWPLAELSAVAEFRHDPLCLSKGGCAHQDATYRR